MNEDKYIKIISILILITSCIIFIFQINTAFAADYTKWVDACKPYKEMVQNILREEGVSDDYYYLMVAESRCKEKAESNAGALGFWQLMPATGRRFGCTDLHDIDCATHAAAKYIKSLEARFSTFEEVIVAYNMGGHNYIKYGKSAQALGLVRRVRMIQKADK